MNLTIRTGFLPCASLQEIFDTICYHLFTQGRPAANSRDGEEPVCLYLTDDGAKCAAGCLIEACNYRTSFETKTWRTIAESVAPNLSYEKLNLIICLQQAHDSLANKSLGKKEFCQKLEKHLADLFCSYSRHGVERNVRWVNDKIQLTLR